MVAADPPGGVFSKEQCDKFGHVSQRACPIARLGYPVAIMVQIFRSAILAVLLTARAVPAGGEVRAVLVGVSDYTVLDADLQGPANDVALMVSVLAARGVRVTDMVALTSDASTLPAGVRTAPPTRAGILAALADAAAQAQPGDTVVFYFSGHGGQAPDMSGDEGGGYDEIFLPSDAAGWKGDIAAVENAILDDELQDWARPMLARGVKLVGLIDACHSDTGFRGIGAGGGTARGLSAQDLGIPDTAASVRGVATDPLPGDFVFLYSSQSDQRSFEYPVGDTRLWQGEFTLRLSQVLARSPDAAWAQVLTATAAAMVQGAAPQAPDGEGPMLQTAVFGTTQPVRFAVTAGVVQAGVLQGLNPGDQLALYAEAAGGTALAEVTLDKVAARSAALPATAPAAAWAELVAPAPPPPVAFAAPLRADPQDGFDYAVLQQALGPAQPNADLVPILVDGGVALAGPDAQLDRDGAGSSPRITLLAGEDAAAAVARVRAQASYSLRLRRLLSGVAGRSLTGTPALQLDWQRRPAPDCGAAGQAEPVDPAQGVVPCDQLWLRFTNVSGQDLDVSALYFNADFSVTPLWPTRGLSNRLAPGEAARAGLQINPESAAALEEVLVLAVPVVAGAARVDLTPLAEPVQTRGIGDWFSARLSGDAEAVREFSAKPAPLRMMRQIVRVMPAK